jgi:hypothetical protein
MIRLGSVSGGIVLIAVTLLPACRRATDTGQGDSASHQDTDTGAGGTVTSATIGADGGTLTTPDGLALTLPAGAVSPGTVVTAAVTSSAPPGAVGPAFALGPEGTRFSKPARLTLPFDPQALGSTAIQDLAVGTAVSGGWSGQGFAYAVSGAHTISAYITHLSTWAVIPSTGDACSFNSQCFSQCCPAQLPLVCCSSDHSSCQCTVTGAPDQVFPAFVACLASCTGAPLTSNFASSSCLHSCCQDNSGSTGRGGTCMLPDQAHSVAVDTCSRACFTGTDHISVCPTADPPLPCAWDITFSPALGVPQCGAGVDSQTLYTSNLTLLDQTWGNPAAIEVVGGSYGATDLTAQFQCASGSSGTATGTMQATWDGQRFYGTYALGDTSDTGGGTFFVNPGQWP